MMKISGPDSDMMKLMAERRKQIEAMARQRLSMQERDKRNRRRKPKGPTARIPENAMGGGGERTTGVPTHLPRKDVQQQIFEDVMKRRLRP